MTDETYDQDRASDDERLADPDVETILGPDGRRAPRDDDRPVVADADDHVLDEHDSEA